jgi:hypothetical protein
MTISPIADTMFSLRTTLGGYERSKALPESGTTLEYMFGNEVTKVAFQPRKDGAFNVLAGVTTYYRPPDDDIRDIRKVVDFGVASADDRERILCAFNSRNMGVPVDPVGDIKDRSIGQKVGHAHYVSGMLFATPQSRLTALKQSLKLQ